MGMMFIPLLPIHLGFFPALYFIQNKYLLVPAVMANQHLLCHPYKALLYVHDIELVEIGVWWTMSVCFFHPTRPKYREIKMAKQNERKKVAVAGYPLTVRYPILQKISGAPLTLPLMFTHFMLLSLTVKSVKINVVQTNFTSPVNALISVRT